MECWKKKINALVQNVLIKCLIWATKAIWNWTHLFSGTAEVKKTDKGFRRFFLTVKVQMQKYIFIASVHSVICFSSPALKGLKSKVLCAHIFIYRDRAVLLNLSGCFLQLSCKLDQTKIKWERLYQSVNLQDTAASRDHNTHVLISLLL